MGRRGRLPDPNSKTSQAALARARNIAGVNAQSKRQPPPDGVQMPQSVQLVPAAAAFWGRVSPALVADGRLVPEQADSFAILCRLHAEIRQLEDQVLAEGWITATDKGQAASPVAKLLRDSRRDFVTLARDFGLTAASAARIPQDQPDGEEEGDEESALLKRLSVRG